MSLFPQFYRTNKIIKNKRLIEDVEWSATEIARDILRHFKFDLRKMPYTSKKHFYKEWLHLWVDIYAKQALLSKKNKL